MRTEVKRGLSYGAALAYLILVYLFVLAPLAIVMVYSFNSARAFPSPFENFSLEWYKQILARRDFTHGIWVSIQVAGLAGLLSALLSVPLAIKITRVQFPGKDALMAFFMAPLAVPQIVMGLAMLQLASPLGMSGSLTALILVHGVFITPYMLRALFTSLAAFDPAMEEAAMNLGAGPIRTLLKVTLPLIRPGLVAGFIFSFIMSFTNVPLSLFLTGGKNITLPISMLNYLNLSFDPIIIAVGGLTVMGIFFVTLFIEKVVRIRLLV